MASLSVLSDTAVAAKSIHLPATRHDNTRIAQTLLVFSIAWLCLASISIWHSTLDDSYIGFRYAENFAKGLGLVYNSGQRVEGYTNFAWVAMLAGASRQGLDLALTAKVLGIIFNVAALLAAYFLGRSVSTRSVRVYGASLVLSAANPHFIASGVTGLETPLFTAVLCWSLVAYLGALRATAPHIQRRWWTVSAALFAVLVMTRPDGALIYAVLWMYTAWMFRKQLRALVPLTIPFLLLYAPYFAWRWHYYGVLLPNTFYLKRGGTAGLFAKGVLETSRFLGLETGGWFLAAFVALVVILFPLPETSVLALAVAGRVVFELWSGGVSPGEFHFLISALPLFWILAEHSLWGGLIGGGKRRRSLAAGVCVVLLAFEAGSFFAYRQHVERVEMGMQRAHIALGQWLTAHSRADALVAVGDIGAIGLWSHLRILDLDGVTDAHISNLPGTYSDKRDPRYVLEQAPDYVVLRTSTCLPADEDVLFGMDKALHAEPQFGAGYKWVSCWEFWPRYDLVLYQRSPHEQSLIQRTQGSK